MTPDTKTSITVKSSTRKRIKYIAESKDMDYDELINWLLDQQLFPTGDVIDKLILENTTALVEGGY